MSEPPSVVPHLQEEAWGLCAHPPDFLEVLSVWLMQESKSYTLGSRTLDHNTAALHDVLSSLTLYCVQNVFKLFYSKGSMLLASHAWGSVCSSSPPAWLPIFSSGVYKLSKGCVSHLPSSVPFLPPLGLCLICFLLLSVQRMNQISGVTWDIYPLHFTSDALLKSACMWF